MSKKEKEVSSLDRKIEDLKTNMEYMEFSIISDLAEKIFIAEMIKTLDPSNSDIERLSKRSFIASSIYIRTMYEKKQETMNEEKFIQIDVKEEKSDIYRCNMYTGRRCVTIYMHQQDYESLIDTGFFIRDGKELDSANVLNTTNVYIEKP